jgi:hypothetical protein
MSNVSVAFALGMLIVPFVDELVAPDDTNAQWNYIFCIVATILAITNLIFVIIGGATPATWTQSSQIVQ